MRLYKADLHAHIRHSGPAKHLRCRDCHSRPIDVYKSAKRRATDLVMSTDHDPIDGCLEFLNQLRDLPEFNSGEEVSACFPESQHEIHIGVYGIAEERHREIQKVRSNGEELVAYLRRVAHR